MEKVIVLLIAAHVIAEFALVPDWLAERKRRTRYILLHSLIHGSVAYLALQAWACWQAPALVVLLHALIDSLKRRWPDTARAFALGHGAHVAGLFGIVWFLGVHGRLGVSDGIGYPVLVAVAGFVAAVQGAGGFVGRFTKVLVQENELQLDGLKGGGKRIGQLERALIFVFIFVGHPAGIGFLVAAKSILRFEEAKKQKLAEYVLIGTLLSFSLAIALAAATQWAMAL